MVGITGWLITILSVSLCSIFVAPSSSCSLTNREAFYYEKIVPKFAGAHSILAICC